jgi:hypothetical protein
MGSTEQSMKAVGQATAEGFAKTSNQPMQNIPVPAVKGTIPAVDISAGCAHNRAMRERCAPGCATRPSRIWN